MAQHCGFLTDEARRIGERIGIDWVSSRFDVEQFRIGLAVELEHGCRDPATNVSDDDELTTGKISLAPSNEVPDYYTPFGKMEAEAERAVGARQVEERDPTLGGHGVVTAGLDDYPVAEWVGVDPLCMRTSNPSGVLSIPAAVPD
jgi:hypothetical protein